MDISIDFGMISFVSSTPFDIEFCCGFLSSNKASEVFICGSVKSTELAVSVVLGNVKFSAFEITELGFGQLFSICLK